MKLGTSTLILGVALTAVAGLFGAAAFGLIGSNNGAQTSAQTAGVITGHVTTIAQDSAGNIKEYRQSDNIIVNGGENCVLKMLFHHGGGETVGTTVCTGSNTDGWRYIQIGNGSIAAVSTDDRLHNPHNSTSFGTTSSLNIKAGNPTWTNSTSTGSSSQAKVVLSATFTNDKPSGTVTVAESGLWNSTTPNDNSLFARQAFTAITLNAADSLTVQWTINVGGTTSFTGQ